MDIVFRDIRQLKIDHLRQLVDIDAARGDVRRHQDLQGAILELGQGTGTRRLALVAMDGRRRDLVLEQLLGQLVGAVFGAGKDQHLLPVVMANQVRQKLLLMQLRHQMHRLLHHFGRGVAACHFDAARVVEQGLGQGADVVREGGREQQGLALLRHQGDHLADIADKAHIQHTVGLIEHQDLNPGQVYRALPHMVEQTTGRRHQEINAASQGLELRVNIDATEHDHRGQGDMFAIGLHRFLHLSGQFARRH